MGLALVASALGACGSSSSGGGKGGSGGAAGSVAGSGGAGGLASGGGGAAGSGAAGTGGQVGSAGGSPGSVGTGGVAMCGTAGVVSGATCNTVQPTGPCVSEQLSSATPPTPVGGTFSAGSYNLTSMTAYTSSDAGSFTEFLNVTRETYVVSNVTASSFDLATATQNGDQVSRTSGTVAVSGMTASFTKTCPPPEADAGADSLEFTATPSTVTTFTTFTAFSGALQGVLVNVYTKASGAL